MQGSKFIEKYKDFNNKGPQKRKGANLLTNTRISTTRDQLFKL